MAADRTDVGRRSTDDRALGIRIVGDRVGRHAGAISSVEEASRAAEFTRADSAEKSHQRTSGSAGTLRDQDLRLGTGHRPGLGRPRPAGRPDRSKPMPCLPRETLKSRMMDHGSERRKVGPDGGVFHCYIAAYGHERPHRPSAKTPRRRSRTTKTRTCSPTTARRPSPTRTSSCARAGASCHAAAHRSLRVWLSTLQVRDISAILFYVESRIVCILCMELARAARGAAHEREGLDGILRLEHQSHVTCRSRSTPTVPAGGSLAPETGTARGLGRASTFVGLPASPGTATGTDMMSSSTGGAERESMAAVIMKTSSRSALRRA